MSAEISYSIDLSVLIKRMQYAKLVAFDKTGLLNAIGSRQLTWVLQNFQQEGGKDGTPKWAPLRPNTLAKRGPNAKILQDKRFLLRSFDFQSHGDAVDVGVIHDGNQGNVSLSDIAGFHQYGTRGPYVIRPKSAKALRFTVAGGGGKFGANIVFRRSVTHPGLPARPMLPTDKYIFEKLAVDLIEARMKTL